MDEAMLTGGRDGKTVQFVGVHQRRQRIILYITPEFVEAHPQHADVLTGVVSAKLQCERGSVPKTLDHPTLTWTCVLHRAPTDQARKVDLTGCFEF